MKITLQGFGGTLPKVEPRYLPDQAAVVASKVRLDRGHLEPAREPVTVDTSGGPVDSFYVSPPDVGVATLFFAAADVDVVSAPIATKTLYLTGNTAVPQKYFAGSFTDLAWPAPVAAPTATITAGVIDPNTQQTTYFAYTLLRGDEESAPSPLSVAIDTSPNQTVSIGGLPVTHPKRIYRSVTSFSGATELYFVAQVSLPAASFSHTLASSPLGEPIPSTDFDVPPSTMLGIIALPNGIMAGFDGREVCFSEPYIPHAWPEKYRLSTQDKIIGLVSFGTSVAVLTEGTPYIIQGLHPDSMAMARLESTAPCVAKRGIVDVGYAALFPSTDGLMQISASGVQNITEGIFTRSQWQALNPETIVAAQFRGGYAFLHDAGFAYPALKMISKDTVAPSLIDFGNTYRHLQFEPYSGRLLTLHANGLHVQSIDDDSALPSDMAWKSKPFRIPSPMPFGVIYVDAEPPATGTPSFKCYVYADGVNVAAVGMAPNKIERLATPTTLASIWEVQIEGNYTITRVILCGEPDEVFQ